MSTMAATVDIINYALTKLAMNPIISINDNIETARTMSRLYPIILDSELRKHTWNFTIARAALPALVYIPPWGYKYAYALPDDFIRLIQVGEWYTVNGLQDYRGLQNQTPYKLESNMILTDFHAPLKIRYAQRVLDTTQYDTSFVDALACRLAWAACERLTDSSNKKREVMEEYQYAIREATRANAIETPSAPMPDESWMFGRL